MSNAQQDSELYNIVRDPKTEARIAYHRGHGNDWEFIKSVSEDPETWMPVPKTFERRHRRDWKEEPLSRPTRNLNKRPYLSLGQRQILFTQTDMLETFAAMTEEAGAEYHTYEGVDLSWTDRSPPVKVLTLEQACQILSAMGVDIRQYTGRLVDAMLETPTSPGLSVEVVSLEETALGRTIVVNIDGKPTGQVLDGIYDGARYRRSPFTASHQPEHYASRRDG